MSWLTLEIADFSGGLKPQQAKKNLKIVVPKRVIKLATGRNRLRRLIKEALRLWGQVDKNRNYILRVVKNPGEIGLRQAQEKLHVLWPK